MRARFSEFSYGFALTYELCTHYGGLLMAAPSLPSQYAEGKKGGYDVKLPLRGFPLFLQFKRTEYMMRPTAGQWYFFGRRYFRFWLQPLRHSPQHHLLLHLEEKGNLVYYAVPGFYEAQELNEAFGLGHVLQRSLFFRPSDIGRLLDRGDHCVAFNLGERFAYFFSDPKEIPISAIGGVFIEELEVRRRRESAPRLDAEFYTRLADRMVGMVMEQLEFRDVDPRELIRELPPFTRVAFLSRMFFDAELLIVQSYRQRAE